MYVSLVLLAGHLCLSLIHPATRHSLRGITPGHCRGGVGAPASSALGGASGRSVRAGGRQRRRTRMARRRRPACRAR
jgi:hypothetical protein